VNPLDSQLGVSYLGMLDIGKTREIESLDDLAPFLSTSSEVLERILENKNSLIARAVMQKPSGDTRRLFRVPDDEYRNILRRLGQILSSWYLVLRPNSVHGFVKGYSIITNAQQHTQKKIVINVDIKDFFESITREQVKEQFQKLGFNEQISDVLSELTTVDDVLATGFSTSPTLSNFICLVMDGVFESLCAEKEVTYTRYADDITFSSDDYLPKRTNIEEVLSTFGFLMNQKKFRIYRKGGQQYVTGLTVVDARPRLPKRYKRNLRLEAYFIKKYGFEEHFIRSTGKLLTTETTPRYFSPLTFAYYHGWKFGGFVAYIHSIEPKLAKSLMSVMGKKPPTDFEY
jgi:retron-type reverse transcriptase